MTSSDDNDVLRGDPVMVPTPTSPNDEAQKTEPDKTTPTFKDSPAWILATTTDPLPLPGPRGRRPHGYNHAHQPRRRPGAPRRRCWPQGRGQRHHRDIDGSHWDPWTQRLLFTTENADAPTYSATPDYPSTVDRRLRLVGRGGYEGIQNDSAGNVWIVEDIGGDFKRRHDGEAPEQLPLSLRADGAGRPCARQARGASGAKPASRPDHLQERGGAQQPGSDRAPHLRKRFKTRWVTIHDTAVDGHASFDANELAKGPVRPPSSAPRTASSTPGSHFTKFFFDETGDTDATARERHRGGWGSINGVEAKRLERAYRDAEDVLQVRRGARSARQRANLSRNQVQFVRRPATRCRTQANALDSGYVWNVRRDYANSSNQPLRWLAEGRDASATIDSANDGFGKNDGDNEITGLHVSRWGSRGPRGPWSPGAKAGGVELALVLHPTARGQSSDLRGPRGRK